MFEHVAYDDELQVKLPDASDHNALRELAQKWSDVSTADLFKYNLGCLEWLPWTDMPKDVPPNQTDYFSGQQHYQCYGLNVQAMCDPDLLFLYVAVAAPGKVNDIPVFGGRCTNLLDWLEALPPQYYIMTDLCGLSGTNPIQWCRLLDR